MVNYMAVPKRKTSPSKRNMRRSHHSIGNLNIIEDKESGEKQETAEGMEEKEKQQGNQKKETKQRIKTKNEKGKHKQKIMKTTEFRLRFQLRQYKHDK